VPRDDCAQDILVHCNGLAAVEPDQFAIHVEKHALTGRPRQVLLNDAIASGDARTYQQEAGGTQSPARAAPNRRSDKPIYTRDQVKQFYRAHQQGAYTGREAEWVRRQEADIIRASGEGRILGGVDVAGK
jgi:hypothetical protein